MVNDTRAMRRGIGLACMAVTLAAAMPSTRAHAQFFWDQPRLSADDAARAVMARGFQVLARPTLNNDVYVAEVVDRRGIRERLIIAADTGQILQRNFVEPGRLARRYGDPDLPSGPIPPGTIPNEDREPGLLSKLFGGDDAPDDARQAVPDRPFVEPDRPIHSQHPRRPRTVERTPDALQPDGLESEPLAPSPRAPRTPSSVRHAPVQAALPPATATPRVAPVEPAVVVPTPSDKPVRSISSNPLAIPGSREQDEKTAPRPVRAMPAEQATVTSPKPPAAAPPVVKAPAKETVPVAPLD